MKASRIGGVLLVIGAAAACAEAVAPEPQGPLRGTVNLLTPTPGGRFVQNDPAIGCSSHPYRGYGFRLAFDWEEVEGATRYAIHLKAAGALYPAVDMSVTSSEFLYSWCNAFVIDRNLDNWVWRVAAIADDPTVAAPDTLWSEARAYGFEPCRHPDGAPADTVPPPE